MAGDHPLPTGARRRREAFPSPASALDNFSSKPPFDHLDPMALRGYIDGGFEVIPGGDGGDGTAVRLRCRRDDEADVYLGGFSHPAYARLHQIRCPVTLGCGQLTDAFGPAMLEADALELGDARIEVLPVMGHFGPLERPAQVARSVIGAFEADEGTPRS
jgi:pimeloyl-ACP methyl ester carboxylesterase